MTSFIIVAALLLLAVLTAVLYPFLRNAISGASTDAKAREINLAVLREQRAELEKERASGTIDAVAYTKAREELERRALEDVADVANPVTTSNMRRPIMIGIVALLVPAVVITLYLYLGQPAAMGGAKPDTVAQSGSHAVTPNQIAGMVEKLAKRLQENPSDAEGWLMLARSYGAMGRYTESAVAYGRAIELLPPDAQLLADFADIVAMAQGKKLQGEPEQIVRRALQIDPNNIKALALAGTIAFDRQDYPAAIVEWQKVLNIVPADSSVANGIKGSIRDAENRMALVKQQVGNSSVNQSNKGKEIGGIVTIDPAIASSANPGDTIFIYAKAIDGPKVPLAMMKKKVADLPIQFSLNDSMAMASNFRLSQVKQVIVGARVSKSGDALPRTGDLEGRSATVSPGSSNVKVVINKKVG